MIICY